MKGIRPPECGYCWNIEDLGDHEISDRVIKSSAPYSMEVLDKVVENPLSDKFIPKYVEVSFSHACQFKCSYCSGNFSSTWEEEISKFGAYHNRHGEKYTHTFKEEENPYIAAFWEWWPELKKELHTFRITGGEPLLSPNTFKVLQSLKDQPQKNLHLSINSNLGAPPVLVDKFINYANDLLKNNCVGMLDLYTSIDAFGSRAEYIRHGLNQETFWSNIEKLLSTNDRIKVIIMCTFNALSITSFIELLKKIREINVKYKNEQRWISLEIDIAYLRHPFHQTVKILPDHYVEKMQEIYNFIKDNQLSLNGEKSGFHQMHLIKFKRIMEWMRTDQPEELKKEYQKDFYLFFTEHDRRRGTNFLKAFPEYEEFWNYCKSLATAQSV
ncbi:MAG: twitch domain-containing radical SAM protein, partial [Pseudobdellovibrio sp.]